jgi:L-ascorbate metabolism protein UlaG (beta-lactamase superfamily)
MKRVAPALAALALSACSSEQPHHVQVTVSVPVAPASAASTTPRATDRFTTAKGPLVVTPLEHASVLFGWDGKAIYVDPTLRAIDDEGLPKADLVFLTDFHYDHLDAAAVALLTRPGTVVVGPPAVAARIHVDVVVRNGESSSLVGIVATAVPMYNVARGPATGLRYHERGRGNGYVLEFAGTRVYLSGDGECTPEMRALEHIDLAFVSMNLPTTMAPDEAVECVGAFEPRVLVPYHYWGSDLSRLEGALAGRGVEVRRREFYPRTATLRRVALDACAHGQFGVCRDKLNEAQYLDPAGEDDPLVRRAREQVRAWQAPFPPSW